MGREREAGSGGGGGRYYRAKVECVVHCWLEEGEMGVEAVEREVRRALSRGVGLKVRSFVTFPNEAGGAPYEVEEKEAA